jgi:hypothetical protein
VNKEILSTDSWYQLIKGAYEYCFDLTNRKMDQLKEIQNKRDAGLVYNCIPITDTIGNCRYNYIVRVSFC